MKKILFLISSLIPLCLSAAAREGSISDTSDSLLVTEIIIEGNYVTSRKYILRELDFTINEKISIDDLDYKKQISVNNLTKTSLFNFIEINFSRDANEFLTVIVYVTERWYIWPNLYLNQTDRNFSEWWRTKDLHKLEYGIGLKNNNFRGLGETLLLNYHIGNFLKYELDFRGIYIDKAKRHALSFLATYSAENILSSDIKFNREVFIRESYRLRKGVDFAIKYEYRRSYFNIHNIEVGYSDFNITDTIYSINPYYAGLNRRGLRYFNLRYEFRHDTRDSRIYPKTGRFFLAGINKQGLGILSDEYNTIDLYTQLSLYLKLDKRIYFATGFWYRSHYTDRYVYSSQPGLGFLQFVRGYEYYAVNGSNTLLFKSLVKYELLPMKVINLKIWPIRKLYQFNRIPIEIYINMFFDAGYVSDRFEIYKTNSNTLVNKLMYSSGAGIDFITYYDKVLRIDYSFNGLGENGLFIHWKAAIR